MENRSPRDVNMDERGLVAGAAFSLMLILSGIEVVSVLIRYL